MIVGINLLPPLTATMIVTLIERKNVGGLAREVDLSKDLHALAFKKFPRQAWQTAIKAINNHQVKISESVLQIFDTPSKITDMVADMVVEKLFHINCCSSNISSRTSYCFCCT